MSDRFTWFEPAGRFVPTISEGDPSPLPDDAAYAEAERLTSVLRDCHTRRVVPPADVLAHLDEDDMAAIGLRRVRQGVQ